MNDLSAYEILNIFKLASNEKQLFRDYQNTFQNKILATLFFQPSTRTQLSSQAAFIRLGGRCIGFSNIEDSRSGSSYYESMEDLGSVIGSYCDLVVMRCKDEDQIYDLVRTCHVPIISAGHGDIEHPTQALIDMYTLWSIYKRVDNLTIVIVGTIPSRSMNSLIYGLSKFKKNKIILIGNNTQVFPSDICVEYYPNISSFFNHFTKFDRINAIYLTEIKDCENIENYTFTLEQLSYLSKAKILSPLPRTNILPHSIDQCSNAFYFKEAQNGVYIRAALYLELLNIAESNHIIC